ncbi:MAG: hypothetical protein K0Q47_23 [Sedimentibacter sp.]|jgi:hypothetical protein|nr:hypothetical protein [Sedimentibacter sp.]
MINSYQSPKEGEIFISMWDGDCMIYTIFDTEEEKAAEVARRKKINDEAKEAHQNYIKYLESIGE